MIVFIDDILIYSKSKQEHEEHLKFILELLTKEELYAKFSKCEFWILKVQFLGHVIDSQGIHVDPAKIESIKDWASPTTLTEIRQFLSLAEEAAFQLLKEKLCSAPILALPEGAENFIVYCDASHKGLGVVLMQNEKTEARKQENLEAEDVGGMLVETSRESENAMKEKLEPHADGTRETEVGCRVMWNWDNITMYIITKIPKTSSGYDTIWVMVDRLTKSAHFLPIGKNDSMDKLARLYLKEVVTRHGIPVSIICDSDCRFTLNFWRAFQKALGTRLDMSTAYHPQTDRQSERTIQTLEDILRACMIDSGNGWDRHLPLIKFSYNYSYHTSIKAAPFEALYGQKCQTPICWAKGVNALSIYWDFNRFLGKFEQSAVHKKYYAAVLGTISKVRRTREKCAVLWPFLGSSS
ncbi:putative reverse transcriptase domain-containing protein [Tanacetum coccineum]|uniref:Reverse transcriptase domain-containing protein n=1 Tax=Tanacetum coccineum TaxID=301880 RepID=A0ABQ5HPR6_9ASTR